MLTATSRGKICRFEFSDASFTLERTWESLLAMSVASALLLILLIDKALLFKKFTEFLYIQSINIGEE